MTVRWGVLLGLLVGIALDAFAQGGAARETATDAIQRRVLDEARVTRVEVGMDRLTTVRFPGPIAGLASARVAAEPHPEALFQVYFQPGEAYFSLRALQPGARTSLNVVWQQQTFVLELEAVQNPWLSVVFEAPKPGAPAASERQVAMSPAQWLSRLDLARAYPLLRQQQPATVAGIERIQPNTERDYGDYRIRIEEVFRFDAGDVLVFRLVVSNATAEVLHFIPASLIVRVGTRLYPQSMTDATGEVPAHGAVVWYMAVAGAPDGGRADLSLRNEFTVLVHRVSADVASSVNTSARPFSPEPDETDGITPPGPPGPAMSQGEERPRWWRWWHRWPFRRRASQTEEVP